jgi:hypothetical protein
LSILSHILWQYSRGITHLVILSSLYVEGVMVGGGKGSLREGCCEYLLELAAH